MSEGEELVELVHPLHGRRYRVPLSQVGPYLANGLVQANDTTTPPSGGQTTSVSPTQG